MYVEEAGGFNHDGDVGDLEGNALVAAYRVAKRMALLGVVDAGFQTRLGEADRKRRYGDPAVVECRQELMKASAPLPEEVCGGHPAVLENETVGV